LEASANLLKLHPACRPQEFIGRQGIVSPFQKLYPSYTLWGIAFARIFDYSDSEERKEMRFLQAFQMRKALTQNLSN
jgi:hypothetical protein